MASSNDSTLLGVVLLARHGDRQGFYQDPTTYTSSDTLITPLGNVEEFQLGTMLRGIYMNASSPSLIQNISTGLFNLNQVIVRADAGDEGDVILDSAISLTQGLWPPTVNNTDQLANGTNITAPLGGYQYVPIESVELDEDVSLEGWADCTPFDNWTTEFYNSPAFKQVAADNQAFLNSLIPYLDGRPVTLENMWNIFDYMNVQSIHNATFAKALPPTYLAQARALANYHEYGVFSSPQINGIGNIAGQAIIPSMLTYFSRIVNASDPLVFAYEAISYKPFLSLFNMTGLAQTYPQLATIVDYAAATAFEVRQPAGGGEPVIRFNFKNGTSETTFTTYNLFGASGDVPLSQFVNTLAPVAINSTQDWCTTCQNTVDRGCDAIALASASRRPQKISPVGAGFLGAGLALVVFLAMIAVLAFLGYLSLGRRTKARSHVDETASQSNKNASLKSFEKS